MAMLPSAFNSNDHDEMGTFDALPADWYVAQIEESEIKPTSKALKEMDGNSDLPIDKYSGQRLVLKFKILGGDFGDRTLFNGLNIKNPNSQAVEISQKELTSICKAIGKVSIKDSCELHGIPMKIKLGIKPATAQYDAQNTFKAYEKYDGQPIQQTASASPSRAAIDSAKEGEVIPGKKKKVWE